MKLSLHSGDLHSGRVHVPGPSRLQPFDVSLFTEGFNHPAAASSSSCLPPITLRDIFFHVFHTSALVETLPSLLHIFLTFTFASDKKLIRI